MLSQKFFTPQSFPGNDLENFKSKFFMPILCSYLGKNTKFYSVISNFDTFMPLSANIYFIFKFH